MACGLTRLAARHFGSDVATDAISSRQMAGGRRHNFATEALNDLATGGQVVANLDSRAYAVKKRADVAILVARNLFRDSYLHVTWQGCRDAFISRWR